MPINAGTFEPLLIEDPTAPSSMPKYPRPVSGCAAEVSQRIAEAVFDALVPAIPRPPVRAHPPAPRAISRSAASTRTPGAATCSTSSRGGGYGGSAQGDGLTNGCSTIGISKSQPVEVLEQRYPVLFEEYSLHEGSGGAGQFRGGFGINYRLRLLRGSARASMVMDHGRFGPKGALGGADGGVNKVLVLHADGRRYLPPHLSRRRTSELAAGDVVAVSTPGGGGFGAPAKRDPRLIQQDVGRGYDTAEDAALRFGRKG